MWQRTEDQLGVGQRGILGRHEGDVAARDAAGRPALLVRGCKRERLAGMTKNECAELAAGITAGPEHTDRNLIHE